MGALRLWRLGAILVAVLAAIVFQPIGTNSVEALPSVPADIAARVKSVYVRMPQAPLDGRPLQVLVALHGIGGNGQDFAQPLAEQADLNRWVIVAPTIQYGDWRDPQQIAREDPALIEWISEYLDDLQNQAGVPLRSRILLFGHSRGGQLAHRFALFHPERVRAVAAVSSGTYTLPMIDNGAGAGVAFPYGVSNLTALAGHGFDGKQLNSVQFWVGVGSDDNNPADLPHAWDPFIGDNRVARAKAFQSALQSIGAHSVLVMFPGQRHGLTPEMRSSACTFLRSVAMGELPKIPMVVHGLRAVGF